MSKILRITAKRPGYRRCGIGHPDVAVDHEIDKFDEKQIATLRADPMLVVVEMDSAEAEAAKADAAADIESLRKAAEVDQKAAAEARGEAEADRKKAAEERTAAETAAKEAKADRAEAAKELDAARKARERATAAAKPEAEKPASDDKEKAGRKTGK